MTLKVVLAGVGVRGRHWAEVLTRNPDTQIVAYADPSPAALERVQAEYGAAQTFANAEAALAALADVDALILANPPMGRASQLRAAAERGIPVLVEKPLALDLKEAAQLVAIAESGNIPLMVGLNFRYLGVTQAVMGLLSAGTVGQAAFGRFTYERWRDGHRPDLNKYPLTMAHPMLWEQSIHHFDLMRFVYGREPQRVLCHTWNPPWSMYDDDTNVAAIFIFEGGLSVNYQGLWQSGQNIPFFEWRTDCTQGAISQREQFGELFYARQADTAFTPVDLPPHERWITETAGLLRAFVASINEGAPLACSGRDHLMSLAMVEACIQSSRSGQGVDIEELLTEYGIPLNPH